MYYYRIDGVKSWTVVPPQNYHRLTSSAAQLRANGYPPRPPRSDAHRYAQWKYMVQHWHVASGNGDMCVGGAGTGGR